ncbi:collagen-like triple helix repeat-containing protein [Alcaligenes endophyticus]|uniref:Collagen-like triple helix repeat-containing protein n=1 Tax=Alcaligenes endophyticus TaxID=1929088 RepID=A0ABT8EHB9_9BURK|nr:collagen-like triple helix repeat-containing protein [Alcaligenes endophyticus]
MDLANTAGQLGGSLDTVIEPLVNQVTTLTQGIGDATGLGKTVDGLVGQTGNLIVDLGQQLGQTALPLNVGTGVGGLVEGVGLALGSTGGLLNGTADNPVGNTLGHLTGGINDLTSSLLGPGSIGHDLTNNLGLDGLLNGERQAILEPALANTGTAVDNLLPLGLNNTLGDTGAVLDGVVSPVGAAVTVVTQHLGDSTGLGQPINALLGGLGSALAQAGGQLDHTAPIGLGGTVQHLGQAISSAGGLLQPTTDNPNPLGLTLDHATQSVAALTAPLGGSDGLLGGLTGGLLGGDASNNGLLAPVTNLLAGVTGGLGGGEAMNAGLLAPVTNLLGGVTGGLGGSEAMNAGLLAPVTNLLGGVTGGLGGGEAMNAGLLAPVTNLLGGVTGGLGGGEASNPGLLAPVTNLLGGVTGSLGANAPSADSNSNQQGGLLSPVTGLLGGLVGKRP